MQIHMNEPGNDLKVDHAGMSIGVRVEQGGGETTFHLPVACEKPPSRYRGQRRLSGYFVAC